MSARVTGHIGPCINKTDKRTVNKLKT